MLTYKKNLSSLKIISIINLLNELLLISFFLFIFIKMIMVPKDNSITTDYDSIIGTYFLVVPICSIIQATSSFFGLFPLTIKLNNIATNK